MVTRVKEEKENLEVKIKKLEAFLQNKFISTPPYISRKHKKMLKKQLFVMKLYKKILEKRIKMSDKKL